MVANWDALRTTATQIRRLQTTTSHRRFRKLHHLLCRTLFALQFQRWWCVLAWTVYHKTQGSPWFFELHNSLVFDERYKQTNVRRAEKRELGYLLDHPAWNCVRMAPIQTDDTVSIEEYLMSEEEFQLA
jgi:hypothetical protein